MESSPLIEKCGTCWRNTAGELHRENDLPAFISHDNIDTSWHINGHCHRETGPVIIYGNGGEFWYLNGDEYFSNDMPLNLFLAYCKWEYKKNGK